MQYVLGLTISLVLIIIGIVKWRIHPFLVLIAASLLYAAVSGMSFELILDAINQGFGGVIGSIGLVIIFGVIIGTFLEHSGGAWVLADKILGWVGHRSLYFSMILAGYIVSIPVFCDSGFVMLSALNKTLTKQAGASLAASSGALALGLMATHVMVPPTPGPIAAAGLIGADLGVVAVWGVLVSFLALLPCFFFLKYYAAKIPLEINLETLVSSGPKPSLIKATLPILLPIILILAKSIADYPTHPLGSNALVSVIQFVGTPIIALMFGMLMAFFLPKKWEQNHFSSQGWMGNALRTVAPILLITGAGGVFGKMIQLSGMIDFLKDTFYFAGLGLLFPFCLAALLKTAQGSSTVAIITTASIVSSMLVLLGIDTELLKVLTVLAIGAGAACISHANDSFFWVVTQMTGMNVKQGNQVVSIGTGIFGLTAMFIIYLISFFI
jgi:gluconate:H+ symporter, GntP family